ncbi:transcription factor CP2-like protein 1 isoform X4 [Phacochoerus africanus]|uniref:transcription factor CP2-like protein 1 isoform X4 n=1 Tax=Phacochoerus africanus TaxID=41426 RepID=UPI001FD88AF7|nr:transcription factor CP2-like protein 1 isoform X4 [Phacochoerus africanus]
MLFWHNQPEHLWPSPGELYPGPPSLLRESLPLPYLKQEELPSIPSAEPPCPVFQYVLCAATSPAVRQQEETLTYLNQGQSYEVRMLCNPKLGDATQGPQLLKVHCISTEFTPRKKGGEKGVPFRLQIDTFKPGDKELPPEHLHSAGCLIKVFKPKGADRKLKTDREKIEKQPVHERDKYQTGCDSTIFMECSPWPEPSLGPHLALSPLALTSPQSCKLLSPERLCSSPPFALDTLGASPAQDLNPGASILETQQWLHRHRFTSYCRLLANFTGTDLLKLTRQDLIQICGAADGIRLFNTLRARPIRHRLTLYVAQEASRQQNEVPKNPDSGFYQEISLDELSADELLGKLAEILALPANQIHRLCHQGPGGILILLSDQVVQNIKDESYFVAVVKKESRWLLPGSDLGPGVPAARGD